jgi:hypothetical protein
VDAIFAETYARRCAEDDLRAGHEEDERPGAFRERVRALVFAGLLDAEVALRILSTYGRARELRGLDGYSTEDHGPPAPAPAPVRVARCSGEIDVSGSTLVPRLVMLGARRTRLAATVRLGSGAPAGRGRRHRPPPFFDVHEITLRDDTGQSVTAHLSGGGGSAEWRGWYEAEPGLSPGTAWIEVEGARLALTDADARATVTVETFPTTGLSTAERAARYLAHCAHSDYADHDPAALAVVADTLVTCGVLDRNAPAVTALLEAGDDGGPHPAGFPGGGWTFGPPARGRRGRPVDAATVLVAATTPPVDGITITVTDLEMTPDGFRIEVAGAGPADFSPGYASRIDTPRLVFRAADDLGNHYRGFRAEFEYGSEGFSGTIHFDPALDPAASAVDLEFSTERARAIVRVPMPRSGRP